MFPTAVAQGGARSAFLTSRASNSSPPPRASLLRGSSNSMSASASPPGFHGLFAAPADEPASPRHHNNAAAQQLHAADVHEDDVPAMLVRRLLTPLSPVVVSDGEYAHDKDAPKPPPSPHTRGALNHYDGPGSGAGRGTQAGGPTPAPLRPSVYSLRPGGWGAQPQQPTVLLPIEVNNSLSQLCGALLSLS